ncbi:MAG: beta-1,3-glucanase family protein [Candidatus Saccharimonadales bacterium]
MSSAFARRLQRANTAGGEPQDPGLPATPSPVTVTEGDTRATLWWINAAGATSYDVQYRTSPSGSWQDAGYNDAVTHMIITGLANGTLYDFRVRSSNSEGVSNWSSIVSIAPVATPNTGGGLPLTLASTLVNNSSTNTVYAYIIGLDMNDGRWMLVSSDGNGTYKPPNPPQNYTPLPVDCAIPLNAIGAPGKQVTIPRMVSGRIFFSYDDKLELFTDMNGGFVMPSQVNTNDENIDIQYTFCEFTFNTNELYANISFVDILSIPVAFKLEVSDGFGTQHVPGLPAGGMHTIANRLLAQKAVDGGDWDKCLYYNTNNELVRILSPNTAVDIYPTAFATYLDPYIDQVWAKYSTETLTINTNRVEWGIKTGQVAGGILDFGGGLTFAKPATAAIWSCSDLPFTTGNDEHGNMTARLTAAFHRTTLLINSDQPDGEDPATFYKNPLTNHYSRVAHEVVYGNLGYAFPYDDVHPSGGISYEGRVQSGAPSHWTITVGEV